MKLAPACNCQKKENQNSLLHWGQFQSCVQSQEEISVLVLEADLILHESKKGLGINVIML